MSYESEIEDCLSIAPNGEMDGDIIDYGRQADKEIAELKELLTFRDNEIEELEGDFLRNRKENKELKECAAKNNAEHMRFYYEAVDLRKEIKELKANNKRLREHIKQGMEPAEDNYECEVYMEECWAVLEETKSQSLREIEDGAINSFIEYWSGFSEDERDDIHFTYFAETYKLREES